MIRTMAFAALFAGAAVLPAAAADGATPREFTAKLSAQAQQAMLRNIAFGRGYIVTSDFSQSGSGHWMARALKDGKPLTVAVKMPPRDVPAFIN
jgi:hypothetical protein